MAKGSQVSSALLGNSQIKPIHKVLELNRKEIAELTSNTFNQIYGTFASMFTGKDKNISILIKAITNQFKDFIAIIEDNLTPLNILIGVSLVFVGVFIAHSIYHSFLWNYIISAPMFIFAKFSYVLLWIYISCAALSKFNFSTFLSNQSVLNWLKLGLYAFIGIVIITLLFYAIFIVFWAISKKWFVLYSFLITAICYFAFIADFSRSNLSMWRFLAFGLSVAIFMAIGHFFYNYINKSAQTITEAMISLALYLPIVILFIMITASIQFLQIEALKTVLFGDLKISKLSLAFRAILYGISTDYSKSFIFALCLGWTYNVISNFNTIFVCALISNKLKYNRICLMDSLKLCFTHFGAICYVSLLPGFLASIKSTLLFFVTVMKQADIPIVTIVMNLMINGIINMLSGLELFFNSYNQINFVILAYEGNKCSTDSFRKMNEKVLQKHPESLVMNSPRVLNRILGLQPNTLFALIFSRIEIIMNKELRKYVFPAFIIFQVMSEMILLIGAVIVLQNHHKLVLSEMADNSKSIKIDDESKILKSEEPRI